MTTPTPQPEPDLREALKRVAVALKETGYPFALAGGYAVWARGGPEPEHDVDFLVAEDDAADVAAALAGESDLQVVQPSEDWLFKVFTDGAMVDVLHRDAKEPAERAMIEDADQIEVVSVVMPVLSGTRLMVQRLHAMNEHACDFGRSLPVARALREQVDWVLVRRETDDNDYAVAFLFLLERLGIIDPPGDGED